MGMLAVLGAGADVQATTCITGRWSLEQAWQEADLVAVLRLAPSEVISRRYFNAPDGSASKACQPGIHMCAAPGPSSEEVRFAAYEAEVTAARLHEDLDLKEFGPFVACEVMHAMRGDATAGFIGVDSLNVRHFQPGQTFILGLMKIFPAEENQSRWALAICSEPAALLLQGQRVFRLEQSKAGKSVKRAAGSYADFSRWLAKLALKTVPIPKADLSKAPS